MSFGGKKKVNDKISQRPRVGPHGYVPMAVYEDP